MFVTILYLIYYIFKCILLKENTNESEARTRGLRLLDPVLSCLIFGHYQTVSNSTNKVHIYKRVPHVCLQHLLM